MIPMPEGETDEDGNDATTDQSEDDDFLFRTPLPHLRRRLELSKRV
jgi:hypothetical protein